MDNLPDLRDIHLPSSDISVFPLAYGWWLLLLFLIGIIILFKIVVLIKRTSARVYACNLLIKLKNQYNLITVVKMSEILRRVCVRKYPEAVSLFGDKWIDFLNSKSKNTLDGKAAELLVNAPFMCENIETCDEDHVKTIWHFCYDWIGDNL